MSGPSLSIQFHSECRGNPWIYIGSLILLPAPSPYDMHQFGRFPPSNSSHPSHISSLKLFHPLILSLLSCTVFSKIPLIPPHLVQSFTSRPTPFQSALPSAICSVRHLWFLINHPDGRGNPNLHPLTRKRSRPLTIQRFPHSVGEHLGAISSVTPFLNDIQLGFLLTISGHPVLPSQLG